MLSVVQFVIWVTLLLAFLIGEVDSSIGRHANGVIREVDSSIGRHANGALHLHNAQESSFHEVLDSHKPGPYLPIHTFGAGFAAQVADDEVDKWSLEYMFHCGNKHFHGPLVLSQALLVLAGIALLIGGTGAAYEYQYGAQPVGSWGPWIDQVMLCGSVYGGVLVYCYDFLADLMVIIGFWYCGYYWWMFFSLCILVGAQIFAAWEFAHEEKTTGEKVTKFMIAICQGHIFYNARESWKQGRVTAHFARHKFIEAIWEAGPQAVFAVYVLYYLGQRDNFWLVGSIFGSVVGLAWGISVWLDFSFNKQLEEDGIEPNTFSVRWYHHCLWGAYFTVDFALRLLTIGLFLSLHNFRPYNQVIFFVLVVVYLLAVMISIQVYHTETDRETWEIFPADIRLPPKHHEESRLLFALHPDLRERLMKIIIPLRALDYLGLGTASMYFNYDEWQCAALISLFLIMHVLLILVLRAQRPTLLSRQREAPALEDLPPDIQRRLSQMESQPFLSREESSNVRRSPAPQQLEPK